MLRAFSVYFTSYGIHSEEIPSVDPGEGLRPVGALALAATAVSLDFFPYVLLMLIHLEGGTSIQNAPDWRLCLKWQ